MKKILLTILFGIFAVSALAAEVYDSYDLEQKWYTNEQNQGMGQGSYYRFKLTSNSKIYLTDMLNTIYSGDQNETLAHHGITQYGYYLNGDLTNDHATNLGDNVTSFDGYTYWDEEGKQTYNRNAYYLGDFRAGSEVEVWMSDGTTKVGTWTPVEGEYTSRWLGREDKLNNEIGIAQLTMYASTGYQVNFGLLTAASDLPVIQEGGGGTFGQPLPTPITTLLIACGFGGLVMVYKKKKGLNF
jgi:hypothetical protein